MYYLGKCTAVGSLCLWIWFSWTPYIHRVYLKCLDKLLDEFLAPNVGKEFNIKMQVCRPTGYGLEPLLDFLCVGTLKNGSGDSSN